MDVLGIPIQVQMLSCMCISLAVEVHDSSAFGFLIGLTLMGGKGSSGGAQRPVEDRGGRGILS